MRPVPVSDEMLAHFGPGHTRQVIAGPGGDLTGAIPPVEALVWQSDTVPGCPVLTVACVLEPGDLMHLAAGGHVYLSFWGAMVPFAVQTMGAVGVTEEQARERATENAESVLRALAETGD